MLENEPSSGAEGTAGHTTEPNEPAPTESAATDASAQADTAAREKRARRRSAATRPAGPPPEPEPAPAAPVTVPATTAAADADAPVESVPAEAEPARESRRKTSRATRSAGAPKTTRTRTRKAKAADEAPAAADDAAAATGSEPAAAAESGDAAEPGDAAEQRSAAEERPTAESARPAEAPAGPAAVSFQPPMVLFQPPVPSERAETAPVRAEPEQESVDEAEDEETAPTAGEDAEDDRPSRRRRRRGGRGRGKSRGGDEGFDAESAGESKEPADERSGSTEIEQVEADSTDDDAGEDGGSSRRRRRRRRRSAGEGGEEAPGPDDPPNTVVRVREPRAAAPAQDEVQAVKGSTRLEAKKQRRREGREQGRRRAPIITESEFLARRESVKRDLVVRRNGERTQIAVLEDDVLVEHYVDRASHKSYVGNVYLGRVQNVLPSMEAAFVDIGKGRNAVLYAGEVNWDASGLEGQPKRIESALKSGQSVLVQVTKDPLGHKGARLTSQISLPGRYMVYVPDGSMTGISRKLPDKERARLKQILKKVMPDNAGVIVRTAAEGASEEELERDISRLAAQWNSIKRKSKSATAPALLNSEPDLTVRVVRDVFNEDFSSLVVSGDEAWSTVKEYVDYVAPHLAERLSHWSGERDVFEAYRIDEQIAKALERKVWLPSGGSLIIDRTEAMTVVDVNTGKFTGQGGNLEETVTKNNLEAAEEIVRQLRLRDIGGIIVIDFIDMVLESNRDLVLRRMLECLSRDRTKHQVAEVTSLGLVQMTRKRVGQGLLEAFSETCECCNGRGLHLSTEPVETKSGGGNGGNGNGRGKKKNKGGSEKAEKQEKADKADKAASSAEGSGGDAGSEEAKPAEQPPAEPEAAPAEPEKKTTRRSSRRKKEAAAAEPAATGGSEAESGAPEEAAGSAGADDGADGADSGAERPRRRRSRRSKSAAAAPESAVAEAG
ncbi:ribonuclease E [Spinactinospora alkalitolerans]|uniref:Ribonuclease E n=1 Tax=Spinactinospora alkalitolerans TaxID=687207 RepID=A0A852TS43_9ACTN|nr:Rne/Rng family ribonuclease [Spinactinospora alkalitolerans]NYE46365.1 ribonuclease E [Spinactinospora alkalitolerans]